MANAKKTPAFIAWHVTEKGKRHFWTRIGAAWVHVQRDRAGTWEVQPHPPEWSTAGAASEG